jgi:hypothetical protein
MQGWVAQGAGLNPLCRSALIANLRQGTERIDRRPCDVTGTVEQTLKRRLAVADRRSSGRFAGAGVTRRRLSRRAIL